MLHMSVQKEKSRRLLRVRQGNEQRVDNNKEMQWAKIHEKQVLDDVGERIPRSFYTFNVLFLEQCLDCLKVDAF